MTRGRMTTIVALALGAIVLLGAQDGFARAMGGGSRGSRSYSAPVRPSPGPVSPMTPSSPSRSYTSPAPMAPPSRPGFLGGLMGGIAGFALGGLLGSMLFGGMGHGFGGIGFLDLILIGVAIFLLMRFLRSRREPAEAMPYAGHTGSGYDSRTAYAEPVEAPAPIDPARADLERGVSHIRQMDPGFDPGAVVEVARRQYATVQGAVSARDIAPIRDQLSPEMYGVLVTQADELRAARRTNMIEKIDVQRAEVTEAWQENGRDYVTVYLQGALIDYTVDDAPGRVVEGSKTDAQSFEEFWTFTRPVGAHPWKLTAIQTS